MALAESAQGALDLTTSPNNPARKVDTNTVRMTDVRAYLRHELDAAYDLMEGRCKAEQAVLQDVAYIEEFDLRPHIRALVARVYPDRKVAGSDEDLMHLVKTADPATLPRLMLRCGTEDHLVKQNERFVAACAAAGVALDSAFEPGEHEWGFWDAQIPVALDFMLAGRG